MIKWIVSDLDETLLNDEHLVGEKNLAAIKKAREAGIKFICATGRGFNQIEVTLDELDLKGERDEYVISFNGAAITRIEDNSFIYFNGLDYKKANELFIRGKDFPLCIEIYTPDILYCYRLDAMEKQRLIDLKINFVEFDEENLEFLKNNSICKVLYQIMDMDVLRNTEEKIRDITDGCCSVSFSSHRYLEINAHQINKGKAILQLADLLGVKHDEIMALGDNHNDVEMLKAVKYGVAVQNAVDEVKKVAYLITDASNNEAAVSEAIEKLIFNQ